jgi:hypothetical protein
MEVIFENVRDGETSPGFHTLTHRWHIHSSPRSNDVAIGFIHGIIWVWHSFFVFAEEKLTGVEPYVRCASDDEFNVLSVKVFQERMFSD